MTKFIKKLNNLKRALTDKLVPLLLLPIALNFAFPHLSYAQTLVIENPVIDQLPLEAGKQELLIADPEAEQAKLSLPENEDKEPKATAKIWVTAYNSLPNQTDGAPCITASGLNVCERDTEDIIATNFKYLPFGTKVRFPNLFGDKLFIVHDRMNARYTQSADIWMKDYPTAKKFGRKYTVMEIY